MKSIFQAIIATLAASAFVQGQTPPNLVVEGPPPIPPTLKAEAGRYLEYRSAIFNSWHPTKREMLITTRFGDSMQLHHLKMPGGARRQLTFTTEPVASGSFRPKKADLIVIGQDVGGGEFYQYFRYDPREGTLTLLTDGKSRNTGLLWSHSGDVFVYASTRRNGRDADLYVMNPADPSTDKLLAELPSGGWAALDWSTDDSKLLLREYLSINESRLFLADARTGAKEPLSSDGAEKVAWGSAQFAADGKSIFVTTDKDSEYQQLARMDLQTRKLTPLTQNIPWNVMDFELSPDGKILAFVVNADGGSELHLLEVQDGVERPQPRLQRGVITGLKWHENSRDLAFTFGSAKSPSDAYSLDAATGQIERWTESETGGLNPENFVEPQIAKLQSFDGLNISALVYQPDPAKFPGKRPVLLNIHGGPEGQARPVFQGANNYYLDVLGIAIVYPNVRGSDGYGKRFLALDNGFKREDSVKDIGAVISWIKTDGRFDPERIAVTGGSYGGYMSLATMEHFNDQLRCGVDVVGISNFLTFLKSTQEYRRDLRRVEYGDERDPKMAEFLERISPTTNVKNIKRPIFVVQGKNDPRVPVTESEQLVKAIRDQGGTAWYLMASDEGHGFRKKKNVDFQFLSTILFFQEQLLTGW